MSVRAFQSSAERHQTRLHKVVSEGFRIEFVAREANLSPATLLRVKFTPKPKNHCQVLAKELGKKPSGYL